MKQLKISILPINKEEKGFIPKKVQIFNNSVGYASKEQGGNLIVKEQWLENPQWEICILIDCEEAEKIKNAICGNKCKYYPYLGKNEHLADIDNVMLEEANKCSFEVGILDCFVPTEQISIADLDYDEREEMGLPLERIFKYEEALPYGMDSLTNHYILKSFMYTNSALEVKEDTVYQLNTGKKIIFY